MRDLNPAMPYSIKALKALEETLKLHQSMVWINPATNTMSVKRIKDSTEDHQPIRS